MRSPKGSTDWQDSQSGRASARPKGERQEVANQSLDNPVDEARIAGLFYWLEDEDMRSPRGSTDWQDIQSERASARPKGERQEVANQSLDNPVDEARIAGLLY